MIVSQKVRNCHFSSFRRKPESSEFSDLQTVWTPAFAGVTTSYDFVNHIDIKKRARFLRAQKG